MDKSKREVLDEFGQKLIQEVRDDTCDFLGRILSGQMRDIRSREFFDDYIKLDPESRAVLRRFLTEAVDSCLAAFLNFLDVNEIDVLFRASSGEQKLDVRRVSDGLAGELYSERGWIARFSVFRDGLSEAG